jgi:hypothetical protein
MRKRVTGSDLEQGRSYAEQRLAERRDARLVG